MINNNIKFCRESVGLTQKELGHILGVAESTVSGWENNHDTIPLEKLIRFCKLYNYSLDYVIGLKRGNTFFNKNITCDKKEIGIKLKKFRKEKKITQKELSKICSISQTTYSNYELGISLITTLNLFIICKTYKLSMDKILTVSKE